MCNYNENYYDTVSKEEEIIMNNIFDNLTMCPLYEHGIDHKRYFCLRYQNQSLLYLVVRAFCNTELTSHVAIRVYNGACYVNIQMPLI